MYGHESHIRRVCSIVLAFDVRYKTVRHARYHLVVPLLHVSQDNYCRQHTTNLRTTKVSMLPKYPSKQDKALSFQCILYVNNF